MDNRHKLFQQKLLETLSSIEEIALLTRDIFAAVLRSFLRNTTEIKPGCEIIIFGYCVKAKEYLCYEFSHASNSPSINFTKRPFTCGEEMEPIVIGDKKAEIYSKVKTALNSFPSGIGQSRAPMSVIKEIILDPNFGTIGGGIQLGYCNSKFGMTVYGSMQPHNGGVSLQCYGFDPHISRPDGRAGTRILGKFFINPPALYF